MHQLWITPHGALKAAARNNADAQTRNEGGAAVTALKFREPGRFDAIVIVGADGLVQRVESRAPDAVLGEVDVVTRYSDYRDFGGVKFPSRIQQSMAGFPVLDLTVRDVQPNAAADIARARRRAQRGRARHHRKGGRRRVVRRRRLAQQRGDRDARPPGAGGGAAQRWPHRSR